MVSLKTSLLFLLAANVRARHDHVAMHDNTVVRHQRDDPISPDLPPLVTADTTETSERLKQKITYNKIKFWLLSYMRYL